MDHPYQSTMQFPAAYAVLTQEEMTYLDGGRVIQLGTVFGYDISFNTDQFVIFCKSAAINAFLLATSYSFSYIKNTALSGFNNGLSASGTFYHTWDKMNGWSRIALFGVATLAGYYAYGQISSFISTAKDFYQQVIKPVLGTGSTQTAAAAPTI